MTRGRFVTLEGGEGAGKSTLARTLIEALQAEGRPVLLTREPGGSDEAEAIRALLVRGEVDRWDGMSETLLLTAARRAHVTRRIEPALARGEVVICDRYLDSTRCYQGAARGVERRFIDSLHMEAVGLHPDLTLILDAPPELGLARARMGEETRFEQFDLAFHHRLRDAFLAIAAAEPARCVVIDAVQSPEAVAEQAMGRLRRLLAS